MPSRTLPARPCRWSLVVSWACQVAFCSLPCGCDGFLTPATNQFTNKAVRQREGRPPAWIFLDQHQTGEDHPKILKSSPPPPSKLSNAASASNPQKFSAGRRTAPNRKTQLRWIAQSVAKLVHQQDEIDGNKRKNTDLVDCLESLANAQTQDQVIQVGNRLSTCVSQQTLSPAVQERVIKAAATTGLFQLAINSTINMLDKDILPSDITQDALCSSLRRAGRANQMEKLLQEIGAVATSKSVSVSSSSFHIMLAALCDDPKSTGFSTAANNNNNNRGQQSSMMNKAWAWIAQNRSQKELGITPGSVSFATVLQAAARNGNRTLVDNAWALMQERGVHPSPFAYNARLKLAGKGSMTRDDETMQIWQQIRKDPTMQPDRYTIDLVLPTLSRRGESEQIKQILDDFVIKNSQFVVSNAFSAFLISLTNAGEMNRARGIFDKYIKPSFAPVFSGDASSMRLVTPSSKQFNVILDGYVREIESRKPWITERATTLPAMEKIKTAAWDLYEELLSARSVNPDEFTYSIMMGLVSSPEDVCKLVESATTKFDKLSPVLQRAAVTSFGDLGDASSACWFFANHVLPSSKSTIREWNVLLGALSKCALHHNHTAIDSSTASATRYFGLQPQSDQNSSPLLKLVDGSSPGDATEKVLQLLITGTDEMRVARPDSQTFCLAVSSLQHGETNGTKALDLFRQSQKIGVPADGRFANAVLRCYGEDIKAAVNAWKEEIRPACLRFERRDRKHPVSHRRSKGKNLVAAYNGLLYCAGRALRPDIGLRLAYAMVKEGVEPNETTLNSYKSGKRVRQSTSEVEENRATWFARKLALLDPYESLLFVECTKYDRNDRRRSGDRRVRIIV